MSGSFYDSTDGSLRPIEEFGLTPQLEPLELSATEIEAIEEIEAQLSHWPNVDLPVEQVSPRTLTATQFFVDPSVIERMAESLLAGLILPPALIIRQQQQSFIHDGHHRTCRALLDQRDLSAVVLCLD